MGSNCCSPRCSNRKRRVDGKEAIARFINRDEVKALQEIGAELLSLEEHLLAKAVTAGEIVEIEHGNYEAQKAASSMKCMKLHLAFTRPGSSPNAE